MVDARRVRRLLQRVESDLSYLRARAALDPAALRRDEDRLAAIKYVFITAIEGCIDIAQHLCASEGWGPPSSNADAVRLLGRQGAIDEKLGADVSRAVGFRNVLVHGYVEVDDGQVVANLGRLGDLERFVAAVSRWLIEQPGEEQGGRPSAR